MYNNNNIYLQTEWCFYIYIEKSNTQRQKIL